jgi:hypothetical protein
VTKGGKRETKETWCFRRMHLDRSVDNVERYKVAKNTAKREVSEARSQMYETIPAAGYEGRGEGYL